MNCFQAFILGLVQGLTEFLPISSSGHMLLVGEILNVKPTLSFELIMHLATLSAVIVYYRKSILKRIKNPLSKENLYLVAATAVTAVVAVIIRYVVGDMQSTKYLPIFFMITATLLFLGKIFARKGRMNYKKSLAVGLAQGLAVIPGLSRSGVTVSIALCLGIENEEATEFSFLLSVPIIIGSSVVELLTSPVCNIGALPLITGLATAFVFGMLSLALIGKIMKKNSLGIFSAYLMALTIILLILKF